MNATTFALVTPSFRRDLNRCELLINSVRKYVSAPLNHYIVVDRIDYDMFAHLQGGNTQLLIVEDVLPWWIFRLPGARRWSMSLKTRPIRNWYLQQLVKLSIPGILSEDVFIFADSDVVLLKPFDPNSFVQKNKVRLYRRPGLGDVPGHQRWHRTAGRLLGLNVKDYYGSNYIGNLITWKRENVLRLYDHLESISGKGWIESICTEWHLSEYILYGVFVEHVLKETSGVYFDENPICLEHWERDDLSETELRKILEKLTDDHVAMMISAKTKLSVKDLEQILP